jgi:quinohemoprotein ethanol dehydrogenase
MDADRGRCEDRREVWTTRTFERLAIRSRRAARVRRQGRDWQWWRDYGVRGFVSAYDAETGKKLWKFYIVPGNPADGPDGEASDSAMKLATPTWSGEWWQGGGGGTAWDSLVYDPTLNLVYLGTGNGAPHVDTIRSPGGGDNLFLCSIVALNADTGERVWHYQMVPAESWDFTCTQPMILADLEIKGRQRQVIMQAPKNGFFYVLDRKTGELLSAEGYVPNTWATSIDRTTGRPVETKTARLTYEPTLMTPGPLASHSWHPMAYSPRTGLRSISLRTSSGWSWRKSRKSFRRLNWRQQFRLRLAEPAGEAQELQEIADSREQGFLLATGPGGAEEAFRIRHIAPGSGGVLVTQGNLLFRALPRRNLPPIARMTADCCGRCRCKTSRSPGR